MLKYSCLVVEDEPLAAEILVDYIGQVPFLELKGVCSDAIYAMEILQTEKIDLIFLDIHLPKLKGMDFLESLKIPPSVIITSAYKDYALQAFDVGVIDYLLKPIRFNRFLKAVGKMNQPNRGHSGEPVVTPVAPAQERKYVYFNVGKKRVKIYMDEIQFIESLKEYVRITTPEKSILVNYHITEMEELLSKDNFMRVHRSFIVSKSKITAFTSTEVEIGGKQIPIGRSYKEVVIALLEGGERQG
ncbi:MAG TPA: response regulator transcription factor [Puia sp.]|nr:response regulator transcription factor [Puia sp.]